MSGFELGACPRAVSHSSRSNPRGRPCPDSALQRRKPAVEVSPRSGAGRVFVPGRCRALRASRGLDWLSSRGPWLLPTRTRRSPRGRGLDLEPTAPLPSRCAETRTVPGPPCAGLSRLTTAQRLVFSLAQLGKPRLLLLKCGPPTPASIGVSG